MTDLEDAWENIRPGEPPLTQILAEGRLRAEAERRRRRHRPLVAMGAVAAASATFIAGAIVGGHENGTPGLAADARPAVFQADLDPARSCDDLLESYQERGLEQVTAWGWANSWFRDRKILPQAGDHVESLSGRYEASRTDSTPSQSSSPSGTNVQEASVDEPDAVKTDGKLVVRLRGNNLLTYDVTGKSPKRLSRLHLPRFSRGEILLSGSTVVALGEGPGSRVITVSLRDPAEPKIVSSILYSSELLTARQHGSTIRLVLAEGLPALKFVTPDTGKTSEESALRANRAAVKASTIHDWLPTYEVDGKNKPLLDCTNVAVPPNLPTPDTVSIVAFDAGRPTPAAIGLAGATTIAYASGQHIYLADSAPTWDNCLMCDMAEPMGPAGAVSGTTRVYDFAVDGVDTIHVASGEVEGTIADRWSMDEADDILRVAVGPSSRTGNFNSLITFERRGQELVEVGRVDGIGKNEELKAVRWFDDLAVLVTFRQVDPLYTIDLKNPRRPRLLGELKIPGFSDYLHPIGKDRLLGIGYTDGSQESAQVGLFDTSDLRRVRRTAELAFKSTDALATSDPRSFTWLPSQQKALTVVTKGQNVSIASITVTGKKLSSSLKHVEYGDDAYEVRTFELPGGRVVLVAGEDIKFFS